MLQVRTCWQLGGGVSHGTGNLGGWWEADALGNFATAVQLGSLPLQGGVVTLGVLGQSGAH